MPFVLIVLSLLASVFWPNKKWKKRFFWIGLSMLLFFSNDFISNEVLKAWELKPTPLNEIKNKQYKLGIVVTGVAMDEQELTDRVFFAKGADRVTHTVQLYKMGIIESVLISGGTGRLLNPDEGEAKKLYDVFLFMGVSEASILIEPDSRNTHESAKAVKELIEGNYKPDDCLLITSAFHMRRSRACFKKAGLEVDTFSVDVYTHQRNFAFDTLFIPKLHALERWHKLSKEWTGMLAYKIVGYI